MAAKSNVRCCYVCKSTFADEVLEKLTVSVGFLSALSVFVYATHVVIGLFAVFFTAIFRLAIFRLAVRSL